MRKMLISLLAFVGLAALPLAAHAANCSAYPYNLTNGTTADASQVMADFNLIRNCANNALAHNGANTDITSIIGSAATLTTPRTIAMTGDISWTSAPFDGSANITSAATISALAVDNSKMAVGAAAANLGYTPVNKAGDTMTGQLVLPVSAIGNSSFRIPQGTAPTSPVNGDIWTTATGAFVRIAGSTIAMASVTPVGCSPSGSAGQVVYNDGALGCSSSAATATSAGSFNLPTYTQNYKIAGATWAGASPDGADTYVGNTVGPVSGGFHTNTGGENVGVGYTSMNSLTTGVANIGIGGGSLTANTTGSSNVAVGRHTLRFHDTGSNNVAIGEFTMGGVGPGSANSGNQNVAVGANALNDNANSGNSNNVAIGYAALLKNTSGTNNVAVGTSAGSSSVTSATGSFNTAVGDAAMVSRTSGHHNVAVGASALTSAVSAANNTAIGLSSFYSTTGDNNAGLGYFAGNATTSGAGNAFVGYNSGLTNTTGSNNTALGNAADVSTAALSGATAIGYNAKVAVSNTMVLGGSANTLVTVTGGLALSAGTTTLAPLKFTAGTNLTSAAAGAMEWDGTNLFVTQTSGPTRKTLVYTTGSVATLTTPRTIAMTGDVTWTSGAFDGSANVTGAGTLATAQPGAHTWAAAQTFSSGAGGVTVAASGFGLRVTGDVSAGPGILQFTNNANNVEWATLKATGVGPLLMNGSALVTTNDSRFSGPTQLSKSADYTFILGDAGGQTYHPSADTTPRAWTIPANGSVAYVIGTKLELVNDCSAGVITLAITTDTLVWFPSGGTGTRSIAACGMATLTKVTSTRWVLTGVGIS